MNQQGRDDVHRKINAQRANVGLRGVGQTEVKRKPQDVMWPTTKTLALGESWDARMQGRKEHLAYICAAMYSIHVI